MTETAAKYAKYVEAFPRFDLVHALGKAGRERPICLYVKESGTVIGEAFLVSVANDEVVLEYVFLGSRIRSGPGVARLKTVVAANGVDKGRRYFLCPLCMKRVGTLVFVRSWACRTCHCLVHRVQLVGAHVAGWEEMDELRARIARGRPLGMWQKTYARKRARDQRRLAELRKICGRIRKFGSDEHRYRITPVWRAIDEIEELAHPYYVIAEGKIVRRQDQL
ncbi:MAG TPA: hypothetical protein VFO51_09410 [Sphingomicrobium sp.]|nr:hypothetical protein [Sphingomicrobium sp.]